MGTEQRPLALPTTKSTRVRVLDWAVTKVGLCTYSRVRETELERLAKRMFTQVFTARLLTTVG